MKYSWSHLQLFKFVIWANVILAPSNVFCLLNISVHYSKPACDFHWSAVANHIITFRKFPFLNWMNMISKTGRVIHVLKGFETLWESWKISGLGNHRICSSFFLLANSSHLASIRFIGCLQNLNLFIILSWSYEQVLRYKEWSCFLFTPVLIEDTRFLARGFKIYPIAVVN